MSGHTEMPEVTLILEDTDRSDDELDTRTIVLDERNPSLQIGRGSQTDQGLQPLKDNAWFASKVMSRSHAKITIYPDVQEVVLSDIGSMHGTYVSGRRLQPEDEIVLLQGQVITLGADIIRGAFTFQALQLKVNYIWHTEDTSRISKWQTSLPSLISESEQPPAHRTADVIARNTYALHFSEDEDNSEPDLEILSAQVDQTVVPGHSQQQAIDIDSDDSDSEHSDEESMPSSLLDEHLKDTTETTLPEEPQLISVNDAQAKHHEDLPIKDSEPPNSEGISVGIRSPYHQSHPPIMPQAHFMDIEPYPSHPYLSPSDANGYPKLRAAPYSMSELPRSTYSYSTNISNDFLDKGIVPRLPSIQSVPWWNQTSSFGGPQQSLQDSTTPFAYDLNFPSAASKTAKVSINDILDKSSAQHPPTTTSRKRKADDTLVHTQVESERITAHSHAPVEPFKVNTLETLETDVIGAETASEATSGGFLSTSSQLCPVSEPIEESFDAATRDSQPARKRIRREQSSQQPSFTGKTLMKYTATALAGVAVGAMSTVFGLAALPSDYFL